MFILVVILAYSLSPLREIVNHPTDKDSETQLRSFISFPYKYACVDWQYRLDVLYSVSITNGISVMSVAISQAQKQRYRITLDLEVMEDFDPHQINWEGLFNLEGSERVVDSYVEDLSKPVSWWFAGAGVDSLLEVCYSVYACNSSYARVCVAVARRDAVYKKTNYPNLQRWQNARVISH